MLDKKIDYLSIHAHSNTECMIYASKLYPKPPTRYIFIVRFDSQ